MPARKMYENYYETGSAARKRVAEPKRQSVVKKPKTVATPLKKTKNSKKKNVKMVFGILVVFSMTMFVTYRFNLINEKNLSAQKLQKELLGVESSAIGSQIEVEQGTDFNQIESYAKQQLGMQKPDKNQTIYVDTRKRY